MNRLLTAKLKSTATSYTEQKLLQPFSVRVNVRDLLHSRGQKVRKKVVKKVVTSELESAVKETDAVNKET